MRPLLLLVSAGMLHAAEPVTFLRDVAPILNKVGCTSGTCHGAAKGKNGFKLSLRGYDPQFDYEALLYDLSGRRFNRADPGSSLMLAKPTQQVAARRRSALRKGLRLLQNIYNWIAQGVPFGDPAKDNVTASRVAPREIGWRSRANRQHSRWSPDFADGKTRDVTREATVESQYARYREGGRVESSRRAHRRSHAAGALPGQVVDGPRYHPESETGLPMDCTAAVQLHRSNTSTRSCKSCTSCPPCRRTTPRFLRRVSLDLTGRLPTPDEVRAFLADTTVASKRAKKIDQLIASPAFVDHWTVKWGDLLQSSRKSSAKKAHLNSANGSTTRSPRTSRTTGWSASCSPAAAVPTTIPPPTTSASRAIPSRRWRRPRRSSWASAWSARSATIIRSNAGRRTSITRWPLSSPPWPSAGLRSRRGDRLRSALRLRDEAPEGWPGGLAASSSSLRPLGRDPCRPTSARCLRRMAGLEGQSVLRESDCESHLELFLRTRNHRPR